MKIKHIVMPMAFLLIGSFCYSANASFVPLPTINLAWGYQFDTVSAIGDPTSHFSVQYGCALGGMIPIKSRNLGIYGVPRTGISIFRDSTQHIQGRFDADVNMRIQIHWSRFIANYLEGGFRFNYLYDRWGIGGNVRTGMTILMIDFGFQFAFIMWNRQSIVRDMYVYAGFDMFGFLNVIFS